MEEEKKDHDDADSEHVKNDATTPRHASAPPERWVKNASLAPNRRQMPPYIQPQKGEVRVRRAGSTRLLRYPILASDVAETMSIPETMPRRVDTSREPTGAARELRLASPHLTCPIAPTTPVSHNAPPPHTPLPHFSLSALHISRGPPSKKSPPTSGLGPPTKIVMFDGSVLLGCEEDPENGAGARVLLPLRRGWGRDRRRSREGHGGRREVGCAGVRQHRARLLHTRQHSSSRLRNTYWSSTMRSRLFLSTLSYSTDARIIRCYRSSTARGPS
ncbi:hypothetical protein C8J57DRAFT_1332584 [Mycena rebaudengoi]|nr:hypothetical protein C8J57DRAFT_1332584 [Mycena rebaudengoi]